MAVSLLAMCLALAAHPIGAQESSFPIAPIPPGALPSLPSPPAQEPVSAGPPSAGPPSASPISGPREVPLFSGREFFPVSQEPKQDKEKQEKQDKDKNGAPTLVYPKNPRLPITGNPYLRNRAGEEEVAFVVQTDLPGLERLTRRESEAQMFVRIRNESDRPGSTKVYFPEETPITREKSPVRRFQPRVALVEPGYVAHGRLLFEQRNFERHGWELGPLQPALGFLSYYYDLAMLPYHIWSKPFDHYEVSAGKCLPGDTVPLLLYPEPFSVTGLAGMAGVYVAGPFVFP